MFVRKTLVGVIATTVAGATLALTAGTASAAPYAPNAQDSKTTGITATDLVGVGSDTSEVALKKLADAWNQGARTDYGQSFDVATFGAVGGDDLPAPLTVDSTSKALVRPNGSGPGRATLYGTGKVSNVDFARSSGCSVGRRLHHRHAGHPVRAGHRRRRGRQQQPGRRGEPDADPGPAAGHLRDLHDHQLEPGQPELPRTRSSSPSSRRPARAPSPSSRARSCRPARPATAPASRTTPTTPTRPAPPCRSTTRRCSRPSPTRSCRSPRVARRSRAPSRPSAATRSRSSATSTTSSAQEESTRADIQAFFGESGFVCSAAAHDLIAAAGFEQLAGAALGGDCGKVLNAASSNFTVNTSPPRPWRSPVPVRRRRTT